MIFKWNNSNNGFAKANNSVISEAKGSHILFLNPDTILPEDCFDQCIAFFKNNKDCGALGVRMIDGAGIFLKESKRSFPSPLTSFFKMTGMANVFPRSKLFANYYAAHLPEKEIAKADVLAGAFIMLSKKALEAVKGFDESFFMYAEDIDVSYRLQQAGFSNYYFPFTTILHFKGESTTKSVAYIKHFYGAMQLFVKKHYKQKKLRFFFMRMAVFSAQALAKMKLSVKMKIAASYAFKPQMAAKPAIVVATHKYLNELVHIIKHAKPPLLLAGEIDIHKEEAIAQQVSRLQAFLEKNSAKTIIFCEASLSFKDIIRLMQQFEGKADFLIHSQGSSSIVGSSSKNEKGIFIAASTL